MNNPSNGNQGNLINEDNSELINNINNEYNFQYNTSTVRSSKFYGEELLLDKNSSIQKESSNKVKFTEELYKNKHYICKKCGTFPLINFINETTISLTCQNKNHEEQIKLNEFIERIDNNKDIVINEYQNCKTHKEKLIKACINCNKNLCTKCEHESNENHIIKAFDELYKEINFIIVLLQNYVHEKYNPQKNKKIASEDKGFNSDLKSIENHQKTESNFEFIQNSKDLIFTVIVESKNCPNYIHYKNIKYLNSYFGEKMELEYLYNKNKSKSKIRLFGNEFVKKNKNNCSLIIDGNIIELTEFYQIENVDKNFNISLLKENEITDMSKMFYDCDILSSISNNSKWKTDRVTNMSYMFYNCKALVYLPETFSDWDTSNVTDMSFMFWGCESLPSLPSIGMLDISKWKTNKVKNLSHMFYGCKKIENLKISKWDTRNVESLCYMFGEYFDLVSIIDIFKWNTRNVKDMSYMFYNCLSLIKFDDGNDDNIYENWKTSKVTNISNMFFGCENLKKIPNFISEWDLSEVQYMSCMFENCKSLESLPKGITDWDTGKVIHMNSMFKNCSSLKELPDISEWKDISALLDINEMIEGCDNLEKMPNFIKWKNHKFVYKAWKKFGSIFD